MTTNEKIWKAHDQIHQARDLISEARTELVLLGAHGFQKQLARIDAELTRIKIRISKRVGVRVTENH